MNNSLKVYVVVWDKRKGLKKSNIDEIVLTRDEAESRTDISGDPEAQENTPRYGYIPVTLTVSKK